MDEQLSLEVHLESADQDLRDLDVQTRRLRSDIQGIGVTSASLLREGPAQPGAKGAEALTVGGVIVTLGSALLPKLIDLLRAWLMERSKRRVRIKGPRGVTVELAGGSTTPQDIQKLVRQLTEL